MVTVNLRNMRSAAKFDCQKFMKVEKRLFYASLPVETSQSEGFHAAATGCPLEALHVEQQNGRPSTDRLHSALKFLILLHIRVYTITTLVLIYTSVAYCAYISIVCHLLDYPLRRRCSCSLDECLKKLKKKTCTEAL